MGKALGIDCGTKRVGVAISDESKTFAREIGIWDAPTFFVKFKEFLEENPDVDQVAVGLPLNMSGEDTQKTEEARKFAQKIETEFSLKTALIDERLTSAMAKNLPGGAKQVDSLAAQIILQTFLDQQKNTEI